MEKTTEELQSELKEISGRIHDLQALMEKDLPKDTRLKLQEKLRSLRFQALFYMEMLMNRGETYNIMS